MGGLLESLGLALIDGIFVATLWFGLLTLGLLAHRQPGRRRELGRIASVGSLAIVPLLLVPGVTRVDLGETVRIVWSPTLEAGGGLSTGPDRGPSWQMLRGRRPAGTDRGRRIAQSLALGWTLMVSLGGARLMLAGLALRRLVGRSTAPSPELRAALDELATEGGRRPPLLVVSERVRSPVLVGLLRPTIVMPASLARHASSPTIAHSLQHELAHADARDTWFTLVAALSRVLWFAIPTSWWLDRQLRLDRELVADQASMLQPGKSAIAYTRILVETATHGGEGAAPLVQRELGKESLSAPSALLDRALMLLQCPFPIEPALPWPFRIISWSCSAVLLLALCHLSLGSRL